MQDFNQGLEGRDTALIRASQNGHIEVVESLLSAGADVHLHNAVCDIYDMIMNDVFYMFYL